MKQLPRVSATRRGINEARPVQDLYETQLQREFYERTASDYDQKILPDDEHHIALKYISGLIHTFSVQSVLDLGCGTGRVIRYIQKNHSSLNVIGLEPVQALLDQAVKQGTTPSRLIRGSGAPLPFADESFDAVVETAVLHHVKYPARVVAEMTRVARKAVFISDHNRFGEGRLPIRFLKLLLYKIGLWDAAKFIQTRGKGFSLSAGDGLAYSYSVYDQFEFLATWADRLVLVPLHATRKLPQYWSPLLTADTILLCAIRDRADVGAGKP